MQIRSGTLARSNRLDISSALSGCAGEMALADIPCVLRRDLRGADVIEAVLGDEDEAFRCPSAEHLVSPARTDLGLFGIRMSDGAEPFEHRHRLGISLRHDRTRCERLYRRGRTFGAVLERWGVCEAPESFLLFGERRGYPRASTVACLPLRRATDGCMRGEYFGHSCRRGSRARFVTSKVASGSHLEYSRTCWLLPMQVSCIFMRMMNALAMLILAKPQLVLQSGVPVPCALQDLLEQALEDQH